MKQKELANKLSNKILNTAENSAFSEFPFKHCVIDDFFDNSIATELLESFPPLEDKIWEKTNDKDIEVKYRTNFQSEFDVPDGKNRKSIILYYYTKEARPSDQNIYKDPHSALWVKKNITDKKGNKSRPFS